MTATISNSTAATILPKGATPYSGFPEKDDVEEETTEATVPTDEEEDEEEIFRNNCCSEESDDDFENVEDIPDAAPARGLNHCDSVRLMKKLSLQSEEDDNDDDDEEDDKEKEQKTSSVALPPPVKGLNHSDSFVLRPVRRHSADAVVPVPIVVPRMARRRSFGTPEVPDTTIASLKGKKEGKGDAPLTRRVSFNEDVTMNHVDNFRHVLKKRERYAVWYSDNEMSIIQNEAFGEPTSPATATTTNTTKQSKKNNNNSNATTTVETKKKKNKKPFAKKKSKIESNNDDVMGFYNKETKDDSGRRFSFMKKSKSKSLSNVFGKGQQKQPPKQQRLQPQGFASKQIDSVHGTGGIVPGGYDRRSKFSRDNSCHF